MKQEIYQSIPSWCMDRSNKYNLLITDDLDALMCYNYQNRNFKRECEFFYTHKYNKDKLHKQAIYRRKDITDTIDINNLIALDCALDVDIKAWDNHVVMCDSYDNYNHSSANLNIVKGICRDNYYKKAIVSSYITMLSYYGEYLECWTKDQLAILVYVDGLYGSFKEDKGYFRKNAIDNLKLLDCEFLVGFIEHNMDYIEYLANKLNLHCSIYMGKDNKLHTNIDLDGLSKIFGYQITLPNCEFELVEILEKNTIKADVYKPSNTFNFVMLGKNKAIYSRSDIFKTKPKFDEEEVKKWFNSITPTPPTGKKKAFGGYFS